LYGAIVIVDAGSTDGTPDELRAREKATRYRMVVEANGATPDAIKAKLSALAGVVRCQAVDGEPKTHTFSIDGSASGDLRKSLYQAAVDGKWTLLELGRQAASLEDVERLVGEVRSRCGRIDILVNNAGINPLFKRPEVLTPEDWDLIMNVDLRGAFLACREVGKVMIAQRSGRIVNVTSATALHGTKRGLPYTAAKAGLIAMTQTLAADWCSHGIRVNAVAPGYVITDLTSGLMKNAGLYRRVLDSGERVALAFFSATALPLVVAITTLAVEGDHMKTSTAAALVGAAILSTLIYPFIGLALRRRARAAGPLPEAAPAV